MCACSQVGGRLAILLSRTPERIALVWFLLVCQDGMIASREYHRATQHGLQERSDLELNVLAQGVCEIWKVAETLPPLPLPSGVFSI